MKLTEAWANHHDERCEAPSCTVDRGCWKHGGSCRCYVRWLEAKCGRYENMRQLLVRASAATYEQLVRERDKRRWLEGRLGEYEAAAREMLNVIWNQPDSVEESREAKAARNRLMALLPPKGAGDDGR